MRDYHSSHQHSLSASQVIYTGVAGMIDPSKLHPVKKDGSPSLIMVLFIVLGAFGGTFVLLLAMNLLRRLCRYVRIEIAVRRLRIPTAPYPPAVEGPYEAGSVHTVCAICIAEFSAGEQVAVLPPCGHLFHQACIRGELAQTNPRCPLCRAALA